VLAHKPTLHSGHLNSILVSLFSAEHADHPVLFLSTGQCLLRLVSCLFSSLVGAACVSCLLTCVSGTVTISYSRLHTTVSLNSWCYNFEPLEERMTKLLEMANYRRWENSSVVHFQDCLVTEKSWSCDQTSAVVVCCGQFQRFYVVIIESMFVSMFTFCLSTLWLSSYPHHSVCVTVLQCYLLSAALKYCLSILSISLTSVYYLGT
jgi:hypothetical protein